ncbi:Peroxidase 5 [Linum grandiflorum]
MASPSHQSLVIFPMLLLLVLMMMTAAAADDHLRVGFYKKTCPSAESIVRKAVNKALYNDPKVGGGLLRMHFHDCFVRGCDSSVLLESAGGVQSEKDHPANSPSLRGFEVIDEAKSRIESVCPNTVSCADILTFAARDSSYYLGHIYYPVPAGRRDGRISKFDEVTENLPPPSFNAEQLVANFARKGMSLDEMVTLSGAHSLGEAHCSSFSERLYSFNRTHSQDPSLNRAFAARLRSRCPAPPSNDGENRNDPTVELDPTPNRLDNKYYVELQKGRGLLTSDQTLMDSRLTRWNVVNNARYGATWAAKYAKAMQHMGSLDVLTGMQGEIRRACGSVN